jgi:CheY-like chemotaxis protein
MTRPAATSSQRVLVIDDEPAVGRVIAAILAEDQVEMTTNAKEGLERAAAGDFDIVLCDFLMPAMNGIELYDELCRRRPDLKSSFVLMTGAAIDDELDRFLSATDVFLLRKPFTVREIQCCAALGRRASVTLPC